MKDENIIIIKAGEDWVGNLGVNQMCARLTTMTFIFMTLSDGHRISVLFTVYLMELSLNSAYL